MNSNVLFQISTVLLALALAAVLVVVYLVPEEETYVEPNINEGLIASEEFHLVDEHTGSSTSGKIFVNYGSEYHVKLYADMAISDTDIYGWRVFAFDGLVVDSIDCDFNEDTRQLPNDNGYVSYDNLSYHRPGAQERTTLTTVTVSSSYSLTPTAKSGPGSGSIMIDFVYRWDRPVEDNESIELRVLVGGDGWTSAEVSFKLPSDRSNLEVKGGTIGLGKDTADVKIPVEIGPKTESVDDPFIRFDHSVSIAPGEVEGTYVLTSHVDIPKESEDGVFREYATSMMVNHACVEILSIEETDFPSDNTSYSQISHSYYGYSDLFQIYKGNSTEYDSHSFDVTVTFRFIGDYDYTDLWIRYKVGTLSDGVVTYLQKTCWYNLSETGRYYRMQCIDAGGYISKSDFIQIVKSGDLVYISGDYTRLAEFTEFTQPYDPESTYTGAWYDKSRGVLYSKAFYCKLNDLLHQMHEWTSSLPERPEFFTRGHPAPESWHTIDGSSPVRICKSARQP